MKTLKKILVGTILIYLLALVLDIFISKSFLKSNLFEGEYNTWSSIYNKDIKDDLIIYGSSRSYVHVNPMILDKELKISSYNLGFNGQKVELVKFRNEELIKIIKPKNVVINLDINFLTHTEIYNVEQFIPLMLFRNDVFSLVNKKLNLNYFDLYFPLIRYRKFKYKNVNLLKEIYKIYFYSNYKQDFRYKGFKGMKYSWEEQKNKTNVVEIDSIRKNDLIQMIEDLQKKNINIILINSPEYITQIENQLNREEVIELYNSIANKYKIPFIDYTKDSINYKKELFYNTNHLNDKGADVFTKKLAEDIKQYLLK